MMDVRSPCGEQVKVRRKYQRGKKYSVSETETVNCNQTSDILRRRCDTGYRTACHYLRNSNIFRSHLASTCTPTGFNFKVSSPDMTTKRSTRSGSIESNYIPTGLSLRSETKGILLVREPTTVSNIFLTVLLFACRKYLFFSTHKRLFVYLILLVASVVGDFIKFPKIYFANSNTFLNQYLVKLGWFWTVLWTLSFLVTTSKVFCLNSRPSITVHATRLVVATFFWYFWTNAFNWLEDYYGKCSGGRGLIRSACKSAGHLWKSFDISGHVFILIYSTLVMISEARPIIGWDKIQDVLRNEENARKEGKTVATTFSNLKEEELQEMKTVYKQMTPYVQILFIVITIFVAVWELMLITTMMYFHTMPEKLLAGIVAMSTWFVTYRVWYSSSFLPPLPGDGFFKYQALQKSEVGIQQLVQCHDNILVFCIFFFNNKICIFIYIWVKYNFIFVCTMVW